MVFIIQTSWCESPTCTFGIIPPELANYGCLTAQSECYRTHQEGLARLLPESSWSIDWDRMQEEDFELAYALTVHKAQGSEFAEVLMVVPERRALFRVNCFIRQ